MPTLHFILSLIALIILFLAFALTVLAVVLGNREAAATVSSLFRSILSFLKTFWQ